MKSLAVYLFVVFLLSCAMLFAITLVDPAEPELVIDATPAVINVGVPVFTCIYVMPPLDGTRKGISRA